MSAPGSVPCTRVLMMQLETMSYANQCQYDPVLPLCQYA